MPGLDAIDVEELRRELLGPASLWQQISLVAETGSTNADLAEAARRGEPGGTVLITDYQSAGRGRLGRTWTAPPGTSIAMSVLLRPVGVDPQRWTWLPLLAGLAVTEAVRRAAGLDAVLKWPNDVLLGERKLCGILAERVETSTGPACVIGMGINVALTEADLPVPTATSLALAAEQAGRPAPARTAVILEVLRELGVIVPRWLASPNDDAVARGLPGPLRHAGPPSSGAGQPEPDRPGRGGRHRHRRSAGGAHQRRPGDLRRGGRDAPPLSGVGT